MVAPAAGSPASVLGSASATAAPAPEPLPQQLERQDLGRLRRYREYLDYYEGRRGSPPARGRERVLTMNYARAFVEKGASYLVAGHRPEVVPLDARDAAAAAEAERALMEAWEANDLARLDLETEVDTAVLGDGAYKVTWDEHEQRVVVSAPDVQGLYAWWQGDNVRRIWRVAARYRLPAEELASRLGRMPEQFASRGARPPALTVVEAWTADRFELWAGRERVEVRANPYGAIPYVLFPNLPRPKEFWGVSDIEPLREPLLELNRAFTQLSRILELSGNPIAVLENVDAARDIAVQPGAVWELPEQARAYLLDLLQGGGVRLHVEYVDLVYRALHDLAEMPRIAFGDGRGDRSGVALQTELDPLLRRVERKRLIRAAAFRRRDRLMLDVMAHHTGRRFPPVRSTVRWAEVFPVREPGAGV